MKYLTAIAVILSFTVPLFTQQKNPDQTGTRGQSEQSVLMYRDGAGFFIDVPKDWVIDREAGRRAGTCCVYYPKGSTFHNAETIMYPNIATKGPGQKTVNDFMQSDHETFLKHDPGLRYEEAADIPLQNKRIAKIRLFRGVNHGGSEAVAYIDEEKIIALFVMSSKSEEAFNKSIPLFRSAVKTYMYMNVKVSPDTTKDATHSDQGRKD